MKSIKILIPLLVTCLAFSKALSIKPEELEDSELEGIVGQEEFESVGQEEVEVPQIEEVEEPLNSLTDEIEDPQIPEETGERVKRHFPMGHKIPPPFYYDYYPVYYYYD